MSAPARVNPSESVTNRRAHGGQRPPAGGRLSGTERALLTGVEKPEKNEGPTKWGLADALRPYQAHRVAMCCRWTAWGYEHVAVSQAGDHWAWTHLHRCGSVWTCPVCASAICAQRAKEIADAVAWWRGANDPQPPDVRMMTLTVRHRAPMALRELRAGLCRAWRRLQQSRIWRVMRVECGVAHLVRCIDITWGFNGWHPHAHVLMFGHRAFQIQQWSGRLASEWLRAVEREMGAACVPQLEYGLDVSTCSAGYLARMGLEVASHCTKSGREGHLTPWQIGARVASGEMKPDRWREYAGGMRGCHQLQWSRGLRDHLGEPPNDVECASDDERASGALIGYIPRETWREMANKPGALERLDDYGRRCADVPPAMGRHVLKTYFEERLRSKAWWHEIGGRYFLRWTPPDQNP